jgi:hypothetical protein
MSELGIQIQSLLFLSQQPHIQVKTAKKNETTTTLSRSIAKEITNKKSMI